MQEDPIFLFNQWLKEAEACEPSSPNAMALATADKNGHVSVRMVLLKAIKDGQFIFYTHLESPKSLEMRQNPNVSLCFHWKSLDRQVRIEGYVCQVSDEVADTYFATRDRESQLGTWASKQSQPLKNRAELLQNVQKYDTKFTNKPIPRPSHWSGFAVRPKKIEFWVQKPYRLHDRWVYIKISENDWKVELLYP